MQLHPASFKDPAGFLFSIDGILYRQVNHCYAGQYEKLMQSGLYTQLVAKAWLVPHQEVPSANNEAYKTLQPERLPVITYPYEWCFAQLQRAALHTIRIMRTAMDKGMSLKDASAYNIQFIHGQPVLIDLLSFEAYESALPWKAYRQFCEHFLYPLLLEHYLGVGCITWLRNYTDGIPAEVAGPLLPWRSRWKIGVQLHLHLPRRFGNQLHTKKVAPAFSKKKMWLLLDDLEQLVSSLQAGYPKQSRWNNYYSSTILGVDYLQLKEEQIAQWLSPYPRLRVIDAGANEGYFSLLTAKMGHEVIAIDSDPSCIQRLYQRICSETIEQVYPLVADLSNPSPALGFAHTERSALIDRCTGDLLLALALIHHLVIGKSIPFTRLAPFFASLAPLLLLEFVPKNDEKVQAMLLHREDVFTDYDAAHLEKVFSGYFTIKNKATIGTTGRILYWMERKTAQATI